MIQVRSFFFNVAFYLALIILMIVLLPTLLLPQPLFMRVTPTLWGHVSIWLLRRIAGTKVEFRGLENIPDAGCLVVSKHQSFLETFSLITKIHNPAIILKRELMWIPVFGWYLWKAKTVPINRGSRAAAVAAMNASAAAEIGAGRHILIFAEGTRRPPGAEPAYKQGFSHLYAALDAPILPVAMNSGLFWPRRQSVRRAGTAVIEFLPLVPAGLRREEVFERVRDDIETACARLLEEGRAELGETAFREAMAWREQGGAAARRAEVTS